MEAPVRENLMRLRAIVDALRAGGRPALVQGGEDLGDEPPVRGAGLGRVGAERGSDDDEVVEPERRELRSRAMHGRPGRAPRTVGELSGEPLGLRRAGLGVAAHVVGVVHLLEEPRASSAIGPWVVPCITLNRANVDMPPLASARATSTSSWHTTLTKAPSRRRARRAGAVDAPRHPLGVGAERERHAIGGAGRGVDHLRSGGGHRDGHLRQVGGSQCSRLPWDARQAERADLVHRVRREVGEVHGLAAQVGLDCAR